MLGSEPAEAGSIYCRDSLTLWLWVCLSGRGRGRPFSGMGAGNLTAAAGLACDPFHCLGVISEGR